MQNLVVICFQISIFEPLKTTQRWRYSAARMLWFAFKLVSLNHWKQQQSNQKYPCHVVICFQISIFEPLKTTNRRSGNRGGRLWFAFKLVSLNHWKQLLHFGWHIKIVVICFQISIFEPLKTTKADRCNWQSMLWFAFKLVSLNHWKQLFWLRNNRSTRCDLLSN